MPFKKPSQPELLEWSKVYFVVGKNDVKLKGDLSAFAPGCTQKTPIVILVKKMKNVEKIYYIFLSIFPLLFRY